MTRYLPGRVWGVVRLLALSKRFGLHKTTISGTLPLQVGFQTSLGVLVALPLLFSREIRVTTDFRFADIQLSGDRLLIIGCGGFFITVVLFFSFRAPAG